jgi:hypothetical protein
MWRMKATQALLSAVNIILNMLAKQKLILEFKAYGKPIQRD